ncbi:MAG TPA: cysteine desulfurase NifS, partial [Deltaproteobacteria bacterium]|nr:cysteine desulfurase NifS [Deltaproteobacteria bacterium]
TYNAVGIVGFGKAAELCAEQMASGSNAAVASLRDRLEEGLLERVGDVEINGDPSSRLPNTTNLSFSGVDGEGLVLNLDLKGIAISTGSACTSGSLDPSHVLVALDKDPVWLEAAIRFSLGQSNTEEQVDHVIDVVATEVARLRQIQQSASA